MGSLSVIPTINEISGRKKKEETGKNKYSQAWEALPTSSSLVMVTAPIGARPLNSAAGVEPEPGHGRGPTHTSSGGENGGCYK